jgi:hypothetical protein
MDLITFSCDACHQVLKVSADNAGKQAKCPRCGAAMVIPNASGPTAGRRGRAEDEDVEARPARPRSRREDDYEEEEDRPRRPKRREDDYEEEGRPRRARRREEDDEDDRDRPRRRGDRSEEEEDDYDRPRRQGMSVRKKWGFVRLGLLLVFIAACVLAGAALLIAVANLLFMISIIAQKDIGLSAFKVIVRIGHGIAFCAALTAIVGYVFCVFVPNKFGTLALAITTLVLGGVNLVVHILFRIVPMFKTRQVFGMQFDDIASLFMPGAALTESQAGAFILSLFVVLLLGAELILFPIFLWAVCRAAKDRWYGGSCIGVAILAGVVTALQLIVLVLFFVGMKHPSRGLAIVNAILMFLSAAAFVGQMTWFLLATWRTRSVVE